MRVLYLTNSPILGGTARILQYFLQHGPSVDIQGCVGVQVPLDFLRWVREQGIPHQLNPMPWLQRRWPFPSLWHAWRLARWAKQQDVRIIHCNEHNVYPFATLLRRFLKCPLVCHVRFRIERAFAEWAFGSPRRLPDALLWTSRQQQEDCAQAVEGIVPKERQHLVRLGVDLSQFGTNRTDREQWRRQRGVAPDALVIGTASALRPIKRLEDFVELVRRMGLEDNRVVGLLAGNAIAGDEPYRDDLVRKIKATNLGTRLQWLGHLEPIEPFYQACDLFVSTSEYETFGNSVCEAMACRLPVVAYRGGSVQEVVGDAGCVVDNGDLPALYREVRILANRPELARALGERAYQRVHSVFDPMHSLQQLKSIYDTLVTKS